MKKQIIGFLLVLFCSNLAAQSNEELLVMKKDSLETYIQQKMLLHPQIDSMEIVWQQLLTTNSEIIQIEKQDYSTHIAQLEEHLSVKKQWIENINKFWMLIALILAILFFLTFIMFWITNRKKRKWKALAKKSEQVKDNKVQDDKPKNLKLVSEDENHFREEFYKKDAERVKELAISRKLLEKIMAEKSIIESEMSLLQMEDSRDDAKWKEKIEQLETQNQLLREVVKEKQLEYANDLNEWEDKMDMLEKEKTDLRKEMGDILDLLKNISKKDDS